MKQVASHFLKDGKRVLVIGGKPMTFGVLRKNHTNHFRKALKSSLIYLQENCGVMLVVDRFEVDDISNLLKKDFRNIECSPYFHGLVKTETNVRENSRANQ